MNPAEPPLPLPFARTVAVHSLGWMLAANLVGAWLGLCLLWPGAGDALAPLTFGRWVPLHLNWQLYGWCALPLVGALLAWCFDPRHPHAARHAQLALGAWSLALALGGVAWLGGTTSGKLFLDWHGWTRPLLPAAMHVLWALLAAHAWWRWPTLPAAGRAGRGLALAVLLVVPTILQWSMAREVYPAVNPDSGGATGAALLGSTLGIVTIYLLLPAMLGLARVSGDRSGLAHRGGFTRRGGLIPRWPFATGWSRPEAASTGSGARGIWILLAASWLVFALIDRGHASHHAPSQVAALAVLGLWIPMLPAAWARWAWPEAARPWRRAAAGWWGLLVLSGWITFLPGFSETLKFTHGLVAHAHLAMAGFVTSVNGMIVVTLAGRRAPRGVFGLWQGGCALFVAAMLALGGLEADRAAELFRHEAWVHVLYALRLAGGVAMTAASVGWLAGILRR